MTVHYATIAGGTAPGGDYTAVADDLPFPAGVTSRTFTVPITPNTIVDGSRTVLLELSLPGGAATLGVQKTATLTITNNDVAGTVQFSAATYTVAEDAGSATITVTRLGGAASGVTVHYATIAGGTAPGGDYTAVADDLPFPAGVTSQTFTVPVTPNTIAEGSRTVFLQLSLPGGAATLGVQKTATLTITNNDVAGTVQFSAATYTVAENVAGGLATITVTRSAGAASAVTVHYATVAGGTAAAGTDYAAQTGDLTFGAGITSQTFTVPTIDNPTAQGNRTVALALSLPGGGASLGAQKTATLTIVDDEVGLQFSAPTFGVSEGAGSATITVVRTGPTAPSISVDYATSDGTAHAGLGGDYTAVAGTLTFGAGVTSRTFTVPILPDTVAEGPETVLLRLLNPVGALLGPQRTAVLTIVDDDVAGSVKFSAATYTVAEDVAGGLATITVTRSGGAASAVTVHYATIAGGTAPGGDYTPVSGDLTFAAGITSQTFTVPIIPNTIAAGSRTVFLQLSVPGGGAILGTPSQATLTITNNDVAGTVQFSAAAYSVAENAASGLATITVTRTGGAASAVTVHYAAGPGGTAVDGTDYTAQAGDLTFGAGITGQTFTVPIIDTVSAEGNRTVALVLSSPGGGATLGAQKTATLTIVDDEVGFRFSQAGYTAGEGSASATITVLRTGPATLPVSVSVATDAPNTGSATPSGSLSTCTAGADYRAVGPTVLAFAAGQASRTFTVPLCQDQVVDGAKTVGLTLSGPSLGSFLGAPATAVLTLTDVDVAGAVRFSAAAYTVAENVVGGLATITATRSGGMAGGVTVNYTIADGTAHDPADYTGSGSHQLVFPAGVTSRTFTIPVVDDAVVQSDRTVLLSLDSAESGATIGNPHTAVLTIVDNDRAGTVQFSAPTYSVNESVPGGLATITVTRTGSTATSESVEYVVGHAGDTATDPQDYLAASATPPSPLVFPVGVGSRSFTFQVVRDLATDPPEGNETITLVLQNPSAHIALGAQSTAVLTIVDEQATVEFSALTYGVTEGMASATITVTRTGGTTTAVTVPFAATADTAAAGLDFTPVAGTLTFGIGVASRTFTVPIANNSTVDGDRTVALALGTPTGPAILGAVPTATLTIHDNDAGGTLGFSSAAYGVTEGTPSVTITVLRAGGSAGGVTVHYATTAGSALPGTDYSDVAGTLTFGPAVMSRTFTVPILNDSLADGPRTVALALDTPQGGGSLGTQAAATLTIADNEPTVRFSASSYAVGEGSASISITVLRGGPTTGTVTVDYKTTNGSATAGSDYTTAAGTLTFGPGVTSRTFAVPVLADTVAEGSETVNLVLENPVGATLGSPSAATLTITDNDVAGSLQFSVAAYSVIEGADGDTSAAVITVTRSGGAASAVTVNYHTEDDTALAGTDYEATTGTVTFDAGVTSQAFLVPVHGNNVVDGNRRLKVVLTDPAPDGASFGPTSTATIWIVDDD